MKLKNIAVASAFVAGNLAFNVQASPTITDITSLSLTGGESYSAISNDASVMYGRMSTQTSAATYYWNLQNNSPTVLNNYLPQGTALSQDGSYLLVVGATPTTSNGQPVIMIANPYIVLTGSGTVVPLAQPTNASPNTFAGGFSPDKSLIIGYGTDASNNKKVYLWDTPQGSGAQLTYTPHILSPYSVSGTDHNTNAVGLNPAGLAIGYAYATTYNLSSNVPFVLDTSTNTYTALATDSTYTGGSATVISDSGLAIYGSLTSSSSGSVGAVWSRANTSASFGSPVLGSSFLTFTDASANITSTMSTSGQYLGGRATVGSGSSAITAPIIWRLSDNNYANIVGLSGYTSNMVRFITANNRYVLGTASNVGGTSTHYWIADIGTNASGLTFTAPNTVPYSAPVVAPSPSSTIIDLDNTNLTIANNGSQLNSILNSQNLVLRTALNSDCDKFGADELCFAVGGNYSKVTGLKVETISSNVRIAKKIDKNLRVGVFVDRGWNSTLPMNYSINRSNPMTGLFFGYSEVAEIAGLSIHGSVSQASMSGDVTRNSNNLTNVEVGSGNARFKSKGAQITVSYADKLNNDWIVQPYLGARAASVARTAYSETGVTFPVSYNEVNHSAFTAQLGSKFIGKIDEKLSVKIGVGIEKDINKNIDSFNGTYADGTSSVNLSANLLPSIKDKRIVSSVEAGYQIDKSQMISIQASEYPLSTGKAIQGGVAYMIGF